MEDAQKLIVELLAKLGELDSKVATYQQDMLAQFKKYSDDLLKDVPEAVSSEVSRAIAESMSKYPSLNPPSSRDDGVESQPPTPTDADWKAWDGRKSPPPVLYHTSGIPKMFRVVDGGDRSPHERDREFRGVFTPSYLPLLDDSDRPPRSSPASPRSPNPPVILLAAPPATFLQLPESVAVETEHVEVVVVPEPQTDKGKGKEAVRPIAVRSLTDTTIYSVSSSGSGSESKTRRSALRRSSSSNKGSPRRVRFEFGGTEVLPSSSPETVFGSSQPHFSLGEAENDDIRASSAIDDSELYSSEPYNGPSLLDMEGEEDYQPRPKKVSSTQALRELSRSPFEEGTVWNVVNADTDGSIARTNGESEATGSSDLTPTNYSTAISGSKSSQSKEPTAAKTAEQPHLNESLGSPLQEMERYSDDDESSEEEFLSMRPKSSKSPSPATRSPRERSPTAREPEPKLTEAPQKTPTTNKGQSRADIERLSSRPYAVRVADPEDFASVWENSVVPLVTDILKDNVDCDYSVDVHNYPELKTKSVSRVIFVTLPIDISDDLRKRMQAELAKKIPPKFQGTQLQFLCPKDLSSSREPTQVDEIDFFDWEDDGSRNPSKAEKYLPEVEEEEAVEETETETETPTESTIYSRSPAVSIPRRDAPTATAMKTRFSEGGIGSYKGNSIRMDAANPRVLEEAAALGDLKSFVGSVNGNSGFDPSDINSYRESVGKHIFSGTPRSFSERVMLEDRMALEKGDDFQDDEFANQY